MKRWCTQMRDKTAFLQGTDWCYAILQIKMLWHMGHKHHQSSDLYQQEEAVWESEVCVWKLWWFLYWNTDLLPPNHIIIWCVLNEKCYKMANFCPFFPSLKFGHLCFYLISWSNWITLLKLISPDNICPCARLKGELGDLGVIILGLCMENTHGFESAWTELLPLKLQIKSNRRFDTIQIREKKRLLQSQRLSIYHE